MTTVELNNPDVRQDLLLARLQNGDRLVSSALTRELNVSPDTIRRDLLALEKMGAARRVRGGAVPVLPPVKPFAVREHEVDPGIEALAASAVALVDNHSVIFLDGGTALLAIARRLSTEFRGLVVTPAPAIALAAQARGASVHLIGGTLCPSGAISTGGSAERTVCNFAADMCVLGACGVHPSFGLSADNSEEAGIKRAMAQASDVIMVVASTAKVSRRARHRVLALEEIDHLVTDADVDKLSTIRKSGVLVHKC